MLETFFGIAWENVTVGLLGGFIASGVLYAVRRFKELLLQRQYPIAGTYITKFEDEADGVEFAATAPATLNQRGRRIQGTTELDGRVWVLEGSLTESGYIHGVYHAQNPLDPGLGNFFLRIRNDRTLDGLWSGYDSVNESITSGRYLFYPVERGVMVRDYDDGDRLAVLRLTDEQLGEGYLDAATIGLIDAKDQAFIKIAEVNGRVAGFVLCLLQDQKAAGEMVRGPLPRHLRLAQQIGVLKTVAVSKDAQGRGLGTALVEACLAEFRSRGVQAVYSVAWKSQGKVNIQGVLERASFAPFAEVPDYWREESLALGYDCPSCGAPPCQCSAVMYSNVIR